MVKVIADHDSIKRQIDENIKNPFDAFNEYIWNSIDSGAKNIDITVGLTQSKFINKLEIEDNGNGINYEKLEKNLFGKFNTSLKQEEKEKNSSLPHGNKGYGRFSFILFSEKVLWNTIYKNEKDNKKYAYNISINKNSLDDFDPTKKIETNKKTGTKVSFSFDSMSQMQKLVSKKSKNVLDDLYYNIAVEFAWAIELFEIKLTINKKEIDYSFLIEVKRDYKKEIDEEEISVKFIKWNRPLKNQSSRYYLIDSNGQERYVNPTSFNKQTDEFYHSLYVKSKYFDKFHILKTIAEETYKKIIDYLMTLLKKERKPFLKKFSENKIAEFEEKKLFPIFNPYEDKIKKPIYINIVREVIEFAPSLVASNTNDNQKKILLQLINRLLDDDSSRESLYNILKVLVDEENKDQLEILDEKLKKYSLKNILGLIRFVEDRISAIENLKVMVSEDKHYYLESDLQKEIEKHFWIFGEEYHLMLAAEEDNFTKLRDLYYEKVLKMRKENYAQDKISKRQVDLFVCGFMDEGRLNRNLIVEIKKPKHFLKTEDYRQIEDYRQEIIKIPEMNSSERNQWNFILMYTTISDEHKSFFENKIKDRMTGETVDSTKHMKIFVIKWADLVDEVKFRLKALRKHLENKKEKIIKN